MKYLFFDSPLYLNLKVKKFYNVVTASVNTLQIEPKKNMFKINNFCFLLLLLSLILANSLWREKDSLNKTLKKKCYFFGTTWFEYVWSTWVSNFFLLSSYCSFFQTLSWLESSGPGCGRQCGKLFAGLTGSAGHATTCAWTINAQAQGRTSSTCCHLASDLKKNRNQFFFQT